MENDKPRKLFYVVFNILIGTVYITISIEYQLQSTTWTTNKSFENNIKIKLWCIGHIEDLLPMNYIILLGLCST